MFRYNIFMDSVLQALSVVTFSFALLLIVGGGSAFLIDTIFFNARRNAVWSTYHEPWWDKDGTIRPKHLNCFECEIEVEKAGGELEGHSTME